MYLQPHYGNVVFGNVYFSAGQHIVYGQPQLYCHNIGMQGRNEEVLKIQS